MKFTFVEALILIANGSNVVAVFDNKPLIVNKSQFTPCWFGTLKSVIFHRYCPPLAHTFVPTIANVVGAFPAPIGEIVAPLPIKITPFPADTVPAPLKVAPLVTTKPFFTHAVPPATTLKFAAA